MPLNKQSGEIIGDLGTAYRVVPMAKYVGSPFLEQAADEAYAAFRKAGACILRRFKDEDVLIQEYPQTDPSKPAKVAIAIQRMVKGEELFSISVFNLAPEVISQFRLRGLWADWKN